MNDAPKRAAQAAQGFLNLNFSVRRNTDLKEKGLQRVRLLI